MPEASSNWISEKLAGTVDDGFLKDLFDHFYDGVYVVTRELRIVYWNAGASRITGFPEDEVLGRACGEQPLGHVEADGCGLCGATCPLRRAMDERRPYATRVLALHRDGHRIPLLVRVTPVISRAGEVLGAIQIFSDDTENRLLRAEIDRLSLAASTDPLTGLPNRRALDEALDLAFYRFRRHGHLFGLILLDLDRFKQVNDRHGHAAGDQLLKAVARTLSLTRRRDEIAARWGGEEFVVLVQPVQGDDHLAAAAQRMLRMIERARAYVHETPIAVTASAGATLARQDDTPESILERADGLLYRSKSDGRDRASFD